MQVPARLTATLPLRRGDQEGLARSALETLLNLKLSLKAQLHGEGWRDVSLKDFRATSYFLDGLVHHVVRHTPTGIPGVLVGGAEDGALFPIDGYAPPLTIGMVSSTDPEDYLGCDCYSCDNTKCSSAEEPDVWTHWMLEGLVHSDDAGWRWAYTSATSYGVTRWQQRMHDAGSAHAACGLCRLHNWMIETSPFALPPRIIDTDAALHINGVAHPVSHCSACKASMDVRIKC